MRWHHRHRAQQGLAIVEGLIGAAIVLTFALFAMTSAQNAYRAIDHQRYLAEWQALRDTVLLDTNCAATFAAAGVDPGAPGASCGSSSGAGGQTTPFFALQVGQTTPSALGTYDAKRGGYVVGNWTIRTSCSKAEGTLVVRAARTKKAGGFAADPLTGQPIDWDHPASGLIAGAYTQGGLLTCAPSFNPAKKAKCAKADEVVVAYDAKTNTPTCASTKSSWATANCPAGQALIAYDPKGTKTACAPVPKVSDYCAVLGGSYDAPSGVCRLGASDWFGGIYQTGDGGCESGNAFTGGCSCPGGYVPYAWAPAQEQEKKPAGFDQNVLCVKG
jgi:hypothetical protein